VLLQNADISGSEADQIIAWVEELDSSAPEPATDLPHGRDCLELLGEILVRRGVDRHDAERLLWASYERWMAEEHETLAEVLYFLGGGPSFEDGNAESLPAI
jgi:hypothetical protein